MATSPPGALAFRLRSLSRRKFLWGALAGAGVVGAAVAMRRSILARVAGWTRLPDFTQTPALVPHDPVRDRRTVHVARGATPEANLDAALASLGGISKVVGKDDVVLVKVSAQWWNQGMTNVAAAKRLIEAVVGREGFTGEVIVFENTHFRMADGSGLSRAWTRPSERNVDVPGWSKLGDLIPHFEAARAPVSFVGLVDGGLSALSRDEWHDAPHEHGVYGGDGRGPIAPGQLRDGYHWDFQNAFRRQRSRVDHAQTPLTWPVLTSPRSGLVIDLKDGIFRSPGTERAKVERKLTWITLCTLNEHASTGITGGCKSAMGVVDMSAGRLGTNPRILDYQSVHHFGEPDATWRMAGPLGHFARQVRAPDLYIGVAEWVAAVPNGPWRSENDSRLEAASAHHTKTVALSTDPVSLDWWACKHLLMPIAGANKARYDVDNPDSLASRFLRYYREVLGSGTLDPALIELRDARA